MKVLVTGATGFVGSWLVRRLLSDGVSVRVLRRKSSSASELNDPRIESFWGDVTDAESVNAATRDVHTVFHLAGYIGYSKAQRQVMEDVNVGGTQNVIDACVAQKTTRLVHMSSVVAVGASFDGKNPLTEDSEYNLHSFNFGYFETKWQAEQAVLRAVQQGQLDAVILNPSTIYGPGDATKGSRQVQLKVARGKFPFYSSGGVSIIGVDDVVGATIAAWKAGRSGERYILSGENITIRQLFELIADTAGVQPPAVYLPNMAMQALGGLSGLLEGFGLKGPLSSESAYSSIMYHWYSSAKAQAELGLRPTPAATAIKQSVDWMREHGYLEQLP